MVMLCLLQAVLEDFVEKELGGRVLTCMTGSAPTAPEVIDFLRDALVVPILEGYGSTEAGAPPEALAAHMWAAAGGLFFRHLCLQIQDTPCAVRSRFKPRRC